MIDLFDFDQNFYFEVVFFVIVGTSCEFIVYRMVLSLLSSLTNIEDYFLFPKGSSSRTLSVLRLALRYRKCQNICCSAVAYGSTYSQACFGLCWPKHCYATQLT